MLVPATRFCGKKRLIHKMGLVPTTSRVAETSRRDWPPRVCRRLYNSHFDLYPSWPLWRGSTVVSALISNPPLILSLALKSTSYNFYPSPTSVPRQRDPDEIPSDPNLRTRT